MLVANFLRSRDVTSTPGRFSSGSMSEVSPPWFPALLGSLLERRELTADQVATVFDGLLSGQLRDAETSAFLTAMRMKGETAAELAAAAGVLRRLMQPFDAGREDLLDTCGTGGDDCGTFNISTAAAIVAAAAGVPVVKHGNRAVSSRCGSADVLAELGLPVESGVEWAWRCLEHAGLAFCFAPQFHPAMRHVAALRRRLGVRTMLNLLGPLANPAGAAFQLLGVGRRELLDPIAGALARLGTGSSFVVCSAEGLDEVSLSAPTLFRRVEGAKVSAGEWTPADFGLEPCRLEELRVADAAASAGVIRGILAGESGAARRVVLANAAAALVAAGRADDLRAAVKLAADAVDSGRAAAVLEAMRRTSSS
jgi:anthranilate phosphoribosyltransferase